MVLAGLFTAGRADLGDIQVVFVMGSIIGRDGGQGFQGNGRDDHAAGFVFAVQVIEDDGQIALRPANKGIVRYDIQRWQGLAGIAGDNGDVGQVEMADVFS